MGKRSAPAAPKFRLARESMSASDPDHWHRRGSERGQEGLAGATRRSRHQLQRGRSPAGAIRSGLSRRWESHDINAASQVDYSRVVDLDIGASKSDICAIGVVTISERRQNSSRQPRVGVETAMENVECNQPSYWYGAADLKKIADRNFRPGLCPPRSFNLGRPCVDEIAEHQSSVAADIRPFHRRRSQRQ